MLLVDARGAPLSIIVTGANRHDVTQLTTTLDSIVVERPKGLRPSPLLTLIRPSREPRRFNGG